MQNIDTVFAREFKEMMNGRRSYSQNFKLTDIPTVGSETLQQKMLLGKNAAYVKGIKEDYFSALNGKEVTILPRTTLFKRQTQSDGSFRKDKEGKYIGTQVTVKQGFVAIRSTTSIKLQNYTEDAKGNKIPYKPTSGYRYVDFVDKGKVRYFTYVVPKECVYPMNLCALILTPNRHRVYYSGCRLALQNGNYVYMYVIPYKARENPGYRVLSIKADINFKKEVDVLMQYWTKMNVIFDLGVTSLNEQVAGQTNMGIQTLIGTCAAEDFVKYSGSLADEKAD